MSSSRSAPPVGRSTPPLAELTADRARRAPGPDPDLLERDAAAIARAESLDTGKRLVESEYDIADVVSVFRFYANAARALQPSGESVDTGREGIESRVVKEPVGVCALITPWNYPLLQASWKITPCLAAGATFVLKPSEITPHSTIHLMRLLDEAGLPTGVGNLVLGTGPGCGGPLSTDPRVDLHRPHPHGHLRHHRQVRAAHVLRRVQSPEAQLLRHLVDPPALLGGQVEALALGVPRQHRGLQRHKLVAHEAFDEVLQHPMLF